MKCKYCPSQEELTWKEPFKKGDRPINAQTFQPHTCIETPKNATWKRLNCSMCGIEIFYNRKFKPSQVCEDCKGKEDHELEYK